MRFPRQDVDQRAVRPEEPLPGPLVDDQRGEPASGALRVVHDHRAHAQEGHDDAADLSLRGGHLLTSDELYALKESLQGSKEATQKQLKDIVVLNIGSRQPQAATDGGAPGQQPGIPGGMPGQMGPGGPRPGDPTPVGGTGGPAGGHAAPHPTYHKFLQPISECDESINTLIEQITVDRWPIPQGHRPVRASGAALAVAVTLLESCYPNTGARILSFIGGACIYGSVVGEELKNPIRSWHTIKEDARFMKKATKFYTPWPSVL